MIIIPERQLVIITPPRTGSTALREAVRDKFPEAFFPYRHMEADGVPFGYDRWQRIGVVRQPLDRLWSLYKYCQVTTSGTMRWRKEMRDSTSVPFEEWLLNNTAVFTNPYTLTTWTRHSPQYAVRHYLPENKKSQFIYVRPDLGVELKSLRNVQDILGIEVPRLNESSILPMPVLTKEGERHLWDHFAWDMEAVR